MASRYRCSWCGDVPTHLVYSWRRGSPVPSLEDAMCDPHFLPGPPANPDFIVVPGDSTIGHVIDVFGIQDTMES